jgi:hypothetical protein
VEFASPPVTVVVPAEPGSEGIKRNQTRRGSVEEPIQDADCSDSESVVSTSTVEPKISDDDTNVGTWRCMFSDSMRTRFV